MRVPIGIGTYAYRWAIGTPSFRPPVPMSAPDVVEAAADLGADFVQFADNLPQHLLGDAELAAVRDASARRSLAVELGTAIDLRTDSPDQHVRQLLRYVDLANAFEAPIVRLSLSHASVDLLLRDAMQLFTVVGPVAERAGVRFALENHFQLTAAELLRVADLRPAAVGVCLDTANSIAAGEWPLETAAVLAQRAISLHLKDYVMRPHPEGTGVVVEGAPLGTGRQPARELLELVWASGARPTVTLEQWCPRAADPRSTLERERDWLQRSLEAARAVTATLPWPRNDPTRPEGEER